MSGPILLFVLRTLSAILLLGFLGLITWFIYRDLKMTALALNSQQHGRGALRVIAATESKLALDTLFSLQPVTTIGRNEQNAIVLDDSYASGEHALLAWRGNQWWVEDLGSRNGTLLNGAPLTSSTIIAPGDIISIGDTQLKLEL